METLWISMDGRFVQVALTVSKDTYKIDGDQYHLVQHDGSGYQYLATSGAIKKARKISKKVEKVMAA